ncbi:recombinase family protein [Streptosporangium canum]|uniref:recombinase family protein n=1 Tax=Streptosporangium canum TaxID=324952 RepID=UPI0036A52FF1
MNGSRVGYVRCSTDEQDVVIQTEQLLALDVPEERIYIDRGFSGTTRRNRAGLDQALAAVWDGTVFTVALLRAERPVPDEPGGVPCSGRCLRRPAGGRARCRVGAV